ncbi:MAG: transporter substrate-binding domain-containing protein [Gammaproteobacteria bacterium]|nr:transporter substrate-binding domain-containing protein [Gammaproteobacteria bacterium]
MFKSSWKVGVLFSKTGVTSVIEKTQFNATLLAIREINAQGGVHGRRIEPIVYDPNSNPEKFRQLAKRLIINDSANIIFGCYMSSTRKAVIPIVEDYNGLLWYPTLYEGFEYSKNVIYTGSIPNQNSMFLARYLLSQYGNRFYLVGSNYIYPYESNRIFRDILASTGGKVVGEKYLPLDASYECIDPILVDILEKRPNVIFSTIVGSATSKFYKSYWRAGMQPRQMPIASLTTSEAEVTAMGHEVGAGHITAAPYFETVNTPANHQFVKSYKAMFGASQCTNACAEAAYFQVHLFAHVLRRVGTLDTDIVRTATLGTIFDAPEGTIQIDPDNHHTYLWPKIGRVDDQGKFQIVAETDSPVKPDPYLVDLGSDKSLNRMKYYESEFN